MVVQEYTLYDNNDKIILKTYHSKVNAGKRIYREHHHTECELSLFISGEGTYQVNDKEYTFTPGDVLLFGSNETHCITNIHSEIDLLNIHFEPHILWENPDSIELLTLFFSRNNNFKNIFKNDQVLQEKILKIESELFHKNICHVTETKHHLFSALIYILRNYNYTLSDTEFSKKHLHTIKSMKKAISYIDENLDKKITLSEIAQTTHMTDNYFSCIFKKMNGISPWDYITIKRVEKAITLLQNTDKSKLEIAEMCGFSSSSNFYKMFSKITGKTPSNYSK
jgi:AraC-like DNA-binding protein/mannose-6-phosphate isomerase-like protein (cupin superfamily)